LWTLLNRTGGLRLFPQREFLNLSGRRLWQVAEHNRFGTLNPAMCWRQNCRNSSSVTSAPGFSST
jgi:hypothetical protein